MTNKKKYSNKAKVIIAIAITFAIFAFSAGLHDGHKDATEKIEQVAE